MQRRRWADRTGRQRPVVLALANADHRTRALSAAIIAVNFAGPLSYRAGGRRLHLTGART